MALERLKLRYLLLFVLSLSVFKGYAEKRALIIAIGEYKQGKNGWSDLDVELDIQQMRGALVHNAFDTSRITVIKHEQATKDHILKAFATLSREAQPDDIVFIHYSGHGQQITDKNGDEGDGYDEAICPYDSRPTLQDGVYEGECHITDDEIQLILKKLSEKVGKEGEVIYAVDACHSGSGVRGTKMRGYSKAFGESAIKGRGIEKADGDHNFLEAEIPANLVAFFGSTSSEANYQVWHSYGQQMGSLSFALSAALMEMTERSSYEDLQQKVHRTVQRKTLARQNPSTSGNLKKRVFQGQCMVPDNYFKVTRLNKDLITVNASLFEGVGPGSQLAFCPPELDEYDASKVLAIGQVLKADYAWCQVKLNTPLEKDVLYNSHVFVIQRNYQLRPINVSISCSDNAWAKEIEKDLRDFDTLARIKPESPYLIFSDSTRAIDYDTNKMRKGCQYVYLTPDMDELERAEKIRYALIDHLIAQYLLEQKAHNSTLQAKVELMHPETGKALPLKDGIYQLEEETKFRIKVSNKGPRPFFFNLLYVQSDGLSGQLEPRIGDGHLEPGECQVKPYDELTIEHVFTATEPLGRDVMVVLLENDEINTQPRLAKLKIDLESALKKGRRGLEEVSDQPDIQRQEGASVFQIPVNVTIKG